MGVQSLTESQRRKLFSEVKGEFQKGYSSGEKKGDLNDDGAMVSGAEDRAVLAEEVGGIDFNAGNLDLETAGEKIQFNIPPSIENLTPSDVQSLTPVIINISPITNFPLMLGLVQEDNSRQLSRL